jgi:hypothetical protein
MAVDSIDPVDGHYIFSDAGAPDLGVDSTEVSKQAVKLGTRLMGTAAQRVAYAYARAGLGWQDTDGSKFAWTFDGSDWVPDRVSSGGLFSGSTTAGGTCSVNHGLPVTPRTVQVTDYNSGAVPATRKVLVSAVSGEQIQFYVTNGGAALGGNPVAFYWTARA